MKLSARTIVILNDIRPAKFEDLEQARVELGLTVKDLADLMQVSDATIYRMKKAPGKRLTPLQSLLLTHLRENYLRPMSLA
ncbi:helix-turn-helix domain-containing protein [Ruegeria sediminis]|uniref:Helix-turn-helix domain-containing protein n=1 Tax=Ruegeria sediminis TaxID=2583820 RepID=A0ABY2WTC8_9RHOB|nr:antitoxin Xre-like helix-turn-helix domain-containing protein [Ruegeria sediminis]TMV02574.1 helix-turn-helix domain-containing protein [Ruegeria sediminis]